MRLSVWPLLWVLSTQIFHLNPHAQSSIFFYFSPETWHLGDKAVTILNPVSLSSLSLSWSSIPFVISCPFSLWVFTKLGRFILFNPIYGSLELFGFGFGERIKHCAVMSYNSATGYSGDHEFRSAGNYDANCCSSSKTSAELKVYQAFIFSVPIFFAFILLFLFYYFYLRRQSADWSSLRMRASSLQTGVDEISRVWDNFVLLL